MLAALCAPTACAAGKHRLDDEFFALDGGVTHTHDLVKRIYGLYGRLDEFGAGAGSGTA